MDNCSFYDVPCWLTWLIAEIKLLFVYLYEGILNGLLGALNAIPVPDFLQSIGSLSLPPSVIYFSNAFQLPVGISIVVSAYILRFLIRRLPVIG